MGNYSDGHALGRLKKLFKGLLIACGAAFLLFAAAFIYLSHSSSGFVEDNRDFIIVFSTDLAKNWKPEEVYSRLSTDFIDSLNDSISKDIFDNLSQLGPLLETSDFAIKSYHTGTGGTIAQIQFKAVFENAKALVTITVTEQGDGVKVQAFHVDPIEEFQGQQKLEA